MEAAKKQLQTTPELCQTNPAHTYTLNMVFIYPGLEQQSPKSYLQIILFKKIYYNSAKQRVSRRYRNIGNIELFHLNMY